MPIKVDLVDAEPYRKYEALAPKVRHMIEPGMSQVEIATALDTTPHTVRRALRAHSERE